MSDEEKFDDDGLMGSPASRFSTPSKKNTRGLLDHADDDDDDDDKTPKARTSSRTRDNHDDGLSFQDNSILADDLSMDDRSDDVGLHLSMRLDNLADGNTADC